MGRDLLRRFLEREKLSQAAFAQAAGLAESTISNVLSGARGVGLDVAIAIEKATKGGVPAQSWRKRKAA